MRGGRVILLVVISLVAASAGYAANELAKGSPPVFQHWKVASVVVPNGSSQLVTDGPSLLIEGSGIDGACSLQTVDTPPLRLDVDAAGCGAVPPGETYAVQYGRLGSLQDYWNCKPESAAVRLVHVDPVTHKDHVGPIIMRVSGTCSHDYPLTVYAAGSLWVYDSSAGPTGRSGAIAELSATTGALQTFVTVPGMAAAVIAADDDGFYVGPGEFYQRGQGIYHVAPGSSRARFIRSVSGPMAWLFGFGHTMYAALQYDYAKPCTDRDCQLWSFSGTQARPKLISGGVNPGALQPAGNATVGILITKPAQPSYATSYDVDRIDPATGVTHLLARLPASSSQFIESTAYVSGAFYVLMRSRLFRVSP